MDPMQIKAGLFGGTFNPVHLAHLRMAEEVREAFGIDKIYFIPAANPPHKTDKDLAPAQDRYKMLQAAISEHPGFEISDAELRRPGRSYTIDTVSQVSAMLPQGARCFLIMGLDAFAEIDTWKDYHGLFDTIEVIVISRPAPADPKEKMAEVIFGRISASYEYDPAARRFQHPDKQAVYWFEATALDISASRIRSLAAQGKSIRYLVPEAAERYIYQKGLYI
ncbi:MAG: nicotinate-nucleotide adenylyltransferase [Desulfosalsimonas sp.]|uniref:nicotinate-nucleotide adenylyltransferase n=1 Tax=Desulfosalsimonas sp. TaxID=3073848 RepID=UPI0039710D41